MRIVKQAMVLSITLTAVALSVIGCSSGDQVGDFVTDGEQLYAENCQSCHGGAATGAGRLTASTPSHGSGGHTWHHADGQLVDIVLGRFTYPGREMPSFAGTLTTAQVEAILAYIKVGWNEEMLNYQADVSERWQELQP